MLTNSCHRITIKKSKLLNLYVFSLSFKGVNSEQVSYLLLYLEILLQIKRIPPNPGELPSCSELYICLISEQIIWFINTLPSKEAYALSFPFAISSCPHLPTHGPAPSLTPSPPPLTQTAPPPKESRTMAGWLPLYRNWYSYSSAMQGCLQKVFSPHSRRPPSSKNIWPLSRLLS